MMKLNVYSEIAPLKDVLLHRPGKELDNLTPALLEKLLFDDIPFLDVAREEHDAFANVLRSHGVTVHYLTDLVAEAIEAAPHAASNFIDQFIEDAQVKSEAVKKAVKTYLESMQPLAMVETMIAGIRTTEIDVPRQDAIMDLLTSEYPFHTDPMPNILFQRDPFATIGCGIALNKMSTRTRHRETLFSDFIFTHHPQFANQINRYYSRKDAYSLEGGDILVLNEKTLAIGISKRSDPRALQQLAETLFASDEPFETVLAFNIPKTRAFMHLDTVFTQIDEGIFTVHPGIMKSLTVFEITKAQKGSVVQKVEAPLEVILEKHLDRPIELIPCGGDDVVHSEREQWNDGANTLAIAPGKVVVYSRNVVTNALLKSKGITVLEIPSSELSRGRGGPRCMSMPLYRNAND